MIDGKKVLVLIPAYNEEENIEVVVEKLQQTVPEADYLIMNDCSKDSTEKICKAKGYNYLSLPVNMGIGGCVQTGYRYAVEKDYDIVVQHDGDGQHDPAFIKDVVRPIIEGQADMVIGSRFITKEGFQTTGMRRLGINFLKQVIRLCCGKKVNDVTSGYRATSKELTEFFSNQYAQDYPEPEAIIAAVLNHYRVEEIPVLMHERLGGESSINPVKSVYYMIKVTLAIIIYRLSVKRK